MKERDVFHKYSINRDLAIDNWFESKAEAADQTIKDYVISHKRSLEEIIFWEDNTRRMEKYLEVRKEYINRSIEKNIKRNFAFLDAVDGYISRAIDEGCHELRAWLVEYKNRNFDEVFIEEAESDIMDREFELRDAMPAEKFAVGSRVELGRYYDSSDQELEPLNWIVLDIIDDKALLITDKVVDSMKFNEEWGRINWERCSLRKWLNDQFYQLAFEPADRELIAEQVQVNKDNEFFGSSGGTDTRDKVFLLSAEEAREYYESNEARTTVATDFAKSRGLVSDEGQFASWRLRTPGSNGGCFNAYVYENGLIDREGYLSDFDGCGIRPSIWIDLAKC